MPISTDPKKIADLLTRGIDEVIDRASLEKKLKSGKKLRVKLGIDPTSPNLHLGRSVPLLKLRDFQELGHQVVFIVGDFTGVIGDTSDKDSERPMLDKKTVQNNLKKYKAQAGKIIDLKKTEFHYNSEWLKKLDYVDIAEQSNLFSVSEFINRDNIRRRLDAGTRVSLREVLYPLMQGYDSVAVKADVELGGTDQRFNLLAGRTMQPHFKQAPQDILMNPLVEGTDGRKMSSSWGNTINFSDTPNDMFGKVMSIGDNLIIKYFTYFTRVSMDDIEHIQAGLKQGMNPRDAKVTLAEEIVRMYHGEKAAAEAVAYFQSVFGKKEKPTDMPTLKPSASDILSVLVEAGFVKSRGEGRRDIDGGGVRVNDEKVTSIEATVKAGDIVQKGKRFFVKIV
jgi:tyrosyl-tRNA synthetase